MEKPDIKKIGLQIAEDSVLSVVDKVLVPYAEWYAGEKGGPIGEVLKPFIDDLAEYLKSEVVDQIDGEDEL